MNFLQAILLGIIQGITEFLPISSSGHLLLTQHLLGITEHQFAFDILLHFATLIAIVVFFWKKLIRISGQELIAIVVGTVPIVVIGFLLKDHIEMLFSTTKLVSLTLIVTGIFNLLSDRILEERKLKKDKETKINNKQAFMIGIFQALAIIPGISRSGSTLLGGLHQGLKRRQAFDFAFFLAIPAILGATVLQLKDIWEVGISIQAPINQTFTNFAAGAIAAFISGLASLAFFSYIIKKARMEWFAWYCVSVGVLSFVLF